MESFFEILRNSIARVYTRDLDMKEADWEDPPPPPIDPSPPPDEVSWRGKRKAKEDRGKIRSSGVKPKSKERKVESEFMSAPSSPIQVTESSESSSTSSTSIGNIAKTIPLNPFKANSPNMSKIDNDKSNHEIPNGASDNAMNSVPYENKYFYDDDHVGPYLVYVDVINNGDSRRPINILNLARQVKLLDIRNVNEITKIGYGRGKVTFRDAASANDFVNDNRIKEQGFQPKIFAHFVSTMGTVFPVDPKLTIEELMSNNRRYQF